MEHTNKSFNFYAGLFCVAATTLMLGAVCYFLLIPAALIVGFPRGLRRKSDREVPVPVDIGRTHAVAGDLSRN